MDTLFSEDEEVRRRAKELIDSDSKLSRKTLGWLYMVSEDVVTRVIEMVERADLAQFEAAESIYSSYENIKEKTSMSLRAYCFSLHAHDEANRSWNYFKNWYYVYRHFIVHSQMSPKELAGFSFRLLRAIAESGRKVFDPFETERLLGDLKKMRLRPKNQWQFFKDRREEIKAANESQKRSKGQDERPRYGRSLFRW